MNDVYALLDIKKTLEEMASSMPEVDVSNLEDTCADLVSSVDSLTEQVSRIADALEESNTMIKDLALPIHTDFVPEKEELKG